MTLWIAAVFVGACKGPDGPIQSRPIAPTVAFEDPKVTEVSVVWTDLEDLFPERPASLPELIGALEPGMNGAVARDILEKAVHPGAHVFGEEVEGDLVLSSILRGMNTVQVSVVLADLGKTLREVHVELPDDVSIPMVSTRWGQATVVEHVDGGLAHYHWRPTEGPWFATLIPAIARDRALVRYVAAPTR